MFLKLLIITFVALSFVKSAPQNSFGGSNQGSSDDFTQYINRQQSRQPKVKNPNTPANAEELLENPFFEEFFHEFNKQYRALENESPSSDTVRTRPRVRPTTSAPRSFPTFPTTTHKPEPIVTFRPTHSFIQVNNDDQQPRNRNTNNANIKPRRKRPRVNNQQPAVVTPTPQEPTRFQFPVVEVPENTPTLNQITIDIASPELYEDDQPEEPLEIERVQPTRKPIQTTPKPVSVHISAPRPKPRPQNIESRIAKPKSNPKPKKNKAVSIPVDETDAETFRRQAENAQYMFASEVDDTINGNVHQRQEIRDGKNVKGKYSYSDGFFKRTVHYEADDKGYRVVQEEVEPIGDGPQHNPDGHASVSSYVDGAAVQYRITQDDYKKKNNKVVLDEISDDYEE